MKSRYAYKVVWWSWVALAVIVIALATAKRCEAQMTIPLVQGTVESGDVYELGNRGEPFALISSEMNASTTEVTIRFKRKKYERVCELTYPVDSIDISQNDIEETITLWPPPDTKRNNPEKIEIVSDGKIYRMYVYYKQPIFFFTGKVL